MNIGIPEYLLSGVIYGLGHFINERARAGRGVPVEVRAAYRWLTTMSAVGHESDCNTEESEVDDLIGTAQAALLLGKSERHVRRLQADLGAARLGRSLVFSRRQVIQYADAREEHRGVA